MQSYKKPDFVRTPSSGGTAGRQSRKLLAYKRLRDSAHGALKACGLLGREATTSFISLQRQLPGLLAAPSNKSSLSELWIISAIPLELYRELAKLLNAKTY